MDLQSGQSRRVLANDPSTRAENPPDLTIEGKTWLRNGKVVAVQSDGIAIDNEHGDLYYHAMSSHSLFKIPIADLIDKSKDDEQLTKDVQFVMKTAAPDGMEFGPDGYLYLTDIEHNAVNRWKPGTEKTVETVAQGSDLHWPDSISFGPDGSLWFTTSQINLGPHPQSPYGMWKVDGKKLQSTWENSGDFS
jgi:sugar lactone lactonase YvrE